MSDTPARGNSASNGTFDERVVRESRDRLAQLLSETADDRFPSKEHLQRVIQELSTGLEELLVAEEELRSGAEALAISTAAIDAERERYGELFEFAPDAYLVTDEHGKILEANSGASELLGVPARYLEGKLLVSFVAEHVRRDLRELLRELGLTSEPIDERYLLLQPREGDAFVGAVRAVRRRRSGAEAPLIRWMVRDITQRVRLEEEVRFLNSEVDLLASLGHVARLTAEPQPAESILDRVIELAAQALPSCGVSLALASSAGTRFLSSSSERAQLLDAAEQRQGDGPCLAAMREGVAVELPVAECAARWPAFGEAAASLGLESANGYPLVTPAGRRGALNVYSFRPLSEHERRLVPLLVDQVVAALTNSELYESAHSLAGHLQLALENRGIIEQAKGVLIARQGCSDEEAFDILRRASQRMNRKLRDVAADLVTHVRAGDGPKPGLLSADQEPVRTRADHE